jgi:hypothetical protein
MHDNTLVLCVYLLVKYMLYTQRERARDRHEFSPSHTCTQATDS